MKFFLDLKHAIAVVAERFRKPGRFSIFQYDRRKAISRLQPFPKGVILDLGCGSRELPFSVIAVDLVPNPNVSVVADACKLPFADKQCDGVWMDALLEHVVDPIAVLEEAARVLKDNGWVYCEIPFMQGEHSAPHDFRRWTRQGLIRLFDGWRIEWIKPSAGPFSALAYQLRSCLSLFGRTRSGPSNF